VIAGKGGIWESRKRRDWWRKRRRRAAAAHVGVVGATKFPKEGVLCKITPEILI